MSYCIHNDMNKSQNWYVEQNMSDCRCHLYENLENLAKNMFNL